LQVSSFSSREDRRLPGSTEDRHADLEEGNYAECDDALVAAIRIDGKLAPQASDISLASLASHFESGTLADTSVREQLVQRLNELSGMARVDVHAVANLYLAHRTELVSSDPQVESRLAPPEVPYRGRHRLAEGHISP
jgi:hypothetical protein